MNLHQNISQELQCSRLWVDRSLTMFNLIAAMSYLTIDDKTKLVHQLIEKSEKETISIKIIQQLFTQTPLENWESLPKEVWASMILSLGGDSVSEMLPICLTELIGVEPIEADEEEIASVKKEMWETYTPPEFIPSNLESENDLIENDQKDIIVLTEDNISLASPEPKGTWGIIFRSYSPAEKQFSYTLLNTNRTISSTKLIPNQFWATHRITDWPEAESKEPLCFQTPDCEEESEIIKDFVRQEGPFQCLYLFSITQNLPNPFFSEKLSIGAPVQLEHSQQLFCSALGFQARNKASLEWPGGLKPLSLPQQAILDPSVPKTKLSWQFLSGWRLSLKQVSGNPQEIPALWRINIDQNQRLNGSGGQAGQLLLRNACFLQLKDSEKEYSLGNNAKELELPFRPFLNPDSHHQALFLEERVAELSSQVSLLKQQVTPTLRSTPPIQEERHKKIRTAILSKELALSLFVEQFSQLKQNDPSLDAELFSSNTVDILFGLELQWGTENAGFRLVIPMTPNFAIAREQDTSSAAISLKQSIGSLELFSKETTNSPKHFSLHQEISRQRMSFQKEHPVQFKIQQKWNSSLENPEPIQAPLRQSLQIYNDQIGWNINSVS